MRAVAARLAVPHALRRSRDVRRGRPARHDRAQARASSPQLGGETAHHCTAEIDALADSGPTSIDALCASARSDARHRDHHRGPRQLLRRAPPSRRCGSASRARSRAFPHAHLPLRPDPRARTAAARSSADVREAARRVRARQGPHRLRDAADAADALDGAGFDAALLDPRDFADELPDLERTVPAACGSSRRSAEQSRSTAPAMRSVARGAQRIGERVELGRELARGRAQIAGSFASARSDRSLELDRQPVAQPRRPRRPLLERARTSARAASRRTARRR